MSDLQLFNDELGEKGIKYERREYFTHPDFPEKVITLHFGDEQAVPAFSQEGVYIGSYVGTHYMEGTLAKDHPSIAARKK